MAKGDAGPRREPAAGSSQGAPAGPEVRTLAIEGVKKMIEDGALPTGSRLPSERELAQRLNVSRPSLREALLALELMGYIEIEQRRGIFVKAASPDGHASSIQMDWTQTPMLAFDFLEVREELETRNAALAAQRATDEEMHALLRCIESHERCMKRGEPDTLTAEIDFHLAVARATHNQAQVLLFTTVHEAVHDLIVTVRGSRPPNVGASKTLAQEHRAILDAIRERDHELAASLMRDHMRYADRALRAHFGMSDGDGEARR